MRKLKALYVLDRDAYTLVYGAAEREVVSELVDVIGPQMTRAELAAEWSILKDVDVILSGWGAPRLDGKFLDAAPKLKAFFYGGGALGSVWTPEVWERGIMVTTSSHANSIPVAEYTLGVILLSVKQFWSLAAEMAGQPKVLPNRNRAPGAYGSTVGLISMGMTARAVCELLRPFDMNVIAYDPYLPLSEAKALGVELVGLEELFRRSDVVSLHTPHLPETEGMITGAMLGLMKPRATFINTARGEVVREAELIEVARRRGDILFVLDVTTHEPPITGSALYELRNVLLTPHIAGSLGQECLRLGKYMVDELARYVRGEPLRWIVTQDNVTHTAHRPVARMMPKELSANGVSVAGLIPSVTG